MENVSVISLSRNAFKLFFFFSFETWLLTGLELLSKAKLCGQSASLIVS